MARLRSLLDARNIPIWGKLLIGMAVIVLAILIPAILLLGQLRENLATQFNETAITAQAQDQNTQITSSIGQAQNALDLFLLDASNRRQLEGLLVADVNSTNLNLPRTDRDTLEDLFEATLLNPVTGLYESVRVLDRSGFVIAAAAANSVASLPSGDESTDATFRAAQAGIAEARYETLTVAPLSTGGALDYAVALLWRDGKALGYLIGRMSNTRVLYPGLRFPVATRDIGFAYLASSGGDVITYPEARQRAEAINTLSLARSSFAGEVGVTPVTAPNGTTYYTYVTTVSGAPLALATHLDASYGVAQVDELVASTRLIVFGLSALLALAGVIIFTRLLAAPINRIRGALGQMAAGNLDVTVPDTRRGDEIGALAREAAVVREQFSQTISDLENRAVARNRDFAATQEIARYAATQVNLQLLMDRVVDLVVESFPVLYHAQIFLIDSGREYAMLRASTGEPGRQLLRRGHRLAVGSQSVIGQVTETGELVVARDTAASPVHRRNEFLMDTRAELAIPLKVGALVIGALDVQSRQADVFTPDLVAALQTMADQVSITIQNARLYEEATRRTVEVEEANRRATLDAWQQFLRDQRVQRLTQSTGLKDADVSAFTPLRKQALETGQPALGEPTERDTLPVAVPILLRGQTLGTVEWELPMQSFGEDRLGLAQELAARLAISLENARLFQQSRRAAERERLVNSISARITAQTNVDQILQTAVREVGQALHAPLVAIRLREDDEEEAPVVPPAAGPNGRSSNGTHPEPAAVRQPVQDN